jgi:hypothetical protein
MAEPVPRWEVPELIAALDDGIAGRLLAADPAEGWCSACRASSPCSTRRLAEAVRRAARRTSTR